MKQEYIKNLAEAYVIDNQLYKENLTADELYENFYGLIKDIRTSQPDLTAIIENYNKFEQQGVFVNYFDLIFKPDKVFEDIVIDPESDMETLQEMIGVAEGLTYVLTALLYWKKKQVTKGLIQLVNAINSGINSIGKRLSTLGKSTQLAYAIIQKNSKKCYDECKFDPEQAGPSDYLTQFNKGSIRRDVGRVFQSEKEEEKMECLRMCYLQSMKEVVKLSAYSYFTCLKSTGDLSKLPLERDFSAYQQVLVNSNLNQSCDSMVEVLEKALKSFNAIVDMIYDEDEEAIEIRKQKSELMMDIYNMQKTFSGGGSYAPKAYPPKQIEGGGSQFRQRPPFQKR